MANREDTGLSLLNQKLSLIQNVLRLTESATLSGPGGAESYVALIDERQRIITELKELDADLAKSLPSGEEADLIQKDIERTAKDVIALQEELNRSFLEIMNELRYDMKKVKNGQNLSQAYGINTTAAFGAQMDCMQ